MKSKRDKTKNNKFAERIIMAGVVLLVIFSLAVLVKALTDDETQTLQGELNNLTASLNDAGYSWLADYNLTYLSVEVYREGDNNLLARFDEVSDENWHKIYLTNLSENESYSTFDLLVGGVAGGGNSSSGVEKINYDIFWKKMRIDEIKKELKRGI